MEDVADLRSAVGLHVGCLVILGLAMAVDTLPKRLPIREPNIAPLGAVSSSKYCCGASVTPITGAMKASSTSERENT